MRGSGVLVGAVLVVAGTAIGAQAPGASRMSRVQRTSLLIGSVVATDSTQTPVPDAVVALDGVAQRGLTDAAGNFVLRDVPAGQHALLVRRWGFEAYRVDLTFAGGDTVAQTVELTPVTTSLAAMVVNVLATPRDTRLSEFERRRHVGVGTFLTRDDVAKTSGATLADVLTRVPMVALRRARGGSPELLFSMHGNCAMSIWVDGVRVAPNLAGVPFDPRSFDKDAILGVEVYSGPGDVPTQFNPTGTNCGAIVLWTRQK